MDQYILTPYFLKERSTGLDLLSGLDWQLNHVEALADDPLVGLSVLHEALAGRVAECLRAGHRPVSVAGDCCSAIGVAAGLHRAGIRPSLIWLDAHGDFNTWDTTPSGFLGGMPLAMLVGRGEQTLLKQLELSPLPEDRVILTDARDLDPGESEALASSQVQHMRSVLDLLGIALPESPLWVHFDTDVLDPADAPAMSYPAQSGPSVQDVQTVLARLAGSGRVCAISMSAWNPQMPGAAETQRVCMRLLDTLLAGGGS